MEWTGKLWFVRTCCLMNSFSALRFTEPVMEIICSLTFIILLQMVPPWALSWTTLTGLTAEKSWKWKSILPMIWPLITGMLWQVMLIRMQRTTINPFLKMRAEASTSIQTRAEQLQPQRCIIVRPVSSPYRTWRHSVRSTELQRMYSLSLLLVLLLENTISGRMRYLPLFTTAETIPDFPIPWVCW